MNYYIIHEEPMEKWYLQQVRLRMRQLQRDPGGDPSTALRMTQMWDDMVPMLVVEI